MHCLTTTFLPIKLLTFITRQQERIRILEDEIIRFKKLNLKPDIRPNTKPSDSRGDDGNSRSIDYGQ